MLQSPATDNSNGQLFALYMQIIESGISRNAPLGADECKALLQCLEDGQIYIVRDSAGVIIDFILCDTVPGVPPGLEVRC